MSQTVKAGRRRLVRFQVPPGQIVGTRTLPTEKVDGEAIPPRPESEIRAGVVGVR